MKPSVLLIDDNAQVCKLISKWLEESRYTVTVAKCCEKARRLFNATSYDVFLLDYQLPDGNGLDLVKELRQNNPDEAIILFTGFGNIKLAVKAMQEGADNFLTKPVNRDELELSVKRALDLRSLRLKNKNLERSTHSPTPIFGSDPRMLELKKVASLAASSNHPVLLMGETGTGKGLLARWIHDQSSRNKAPFVEINCSSLREELLASELFGHNRGAFTSAVSNKQGLLEIANNGTLFLDEITNMSINIQGQLLTAIEEKHFLRLGDIRPRRSDFRIICASNRDLKTEMSEGRFREDLFYRLNVLPVELPPLRVVKSIIPELSRHFLRTLNVTSANTSIECEQRLMSYDWPGNIRELRSVLTRAAILAEGGPMIPDLFPNESLGSSNCSDDDYLTLADAVERHIQRIMASCGGHAPTTAKVLGISRSALYRHLKPD